MTLYTKIYNCILWYAIICSDTYAMICNDMQWYAMICYDMQWYAMICNNMLSYTHVQGADPKFPHLNNSFSKLSCWDYWAEFWFQVSTIYVLWGCNQILTSASKRPLLEAILKYFWKIKKIAISFLSLWIFQ